MPKGSVVNGRRVYISKHSRIDTSGKVEIGKNVVIADGVRIITHEHPYAKKENWIGKPAILHKLKLEDEVFLGYNVIVTCGCSIIAKGVVVGAGAVVTKDIIEPYSIWAGNPARKVGMRE